MQSDAVTPPPVYGTNRESQSFCDNNTVLPNGYRQEGAVPFTLTPVSGSLLLPISAPPSATPFPNVRFNGCVCDAKLETSEGTPLYCPRCVEQRLASSRQEVESLKLELQFMIQSMKDRVSMDQMVKQANFLSTWSPDFQGLHSDVELIPAEGCSVPSHRCILAGKSSVFKELFQKKESNAFKKLAVDMDMSRKALQCFVQFFYTGSISPDAMQEHVEALVIAAQKYRVEFLRFLCEDHVKAKLSVENAIWAMDIASKSDSKVIKDAAMDVILPRIHKLPTFTDFSSYVEKNPKCLLQLYHEAAVRQASSRKRPRLLEGGDVKQVKVYADDNSSSDGGTISFGQEGSR